MSVSSSWTCSCAPSLTEKGRSNLLCLKRNRMWKYTRETYSRFRRFETPVSSVWRYYLPANTGGQVVGSATVVSELLGCMPLMHAEHAVPRFSFSTHVHSIHRQIGRCMWAFGRTPKRSGMTRFIASQYGWRFQLPFCSILSKSGVVCTKLYNNLHGGVAYFASDWYLCRQLSSGDKPNIHSVKLSL